jgi:hypothetical protein
MQLNNVQLEKREEVNGEPRVAQTAHPRAVGAPLPRGGSRRTARSTEPDAPIAASAPGRALPPPATPSDAEDHSSSVQRAVHALRSAVPFVQRLLPLLDGNFITAVSNVLTPQPKPAPPVNLAPIHQGLNDLQLQQRELRDQVFEQHTSIQRVEDQLELVREATDRNTLEQQELMEDLKAVGNKVNIVAFVALALLLVSVLLNLFLYLHIEHVLP